MITNMSFTELPDLPVVPNIPDGADLSGLPELDLNLNDFEVPQISRPDPKLEPDNRTFLVLGLNMEDTNPEALDGQSLGMLEEDIHDIPIEHHTTVAAAAAAALKLFKDRDVDQVQVRSLIGGKTHGSFWISEYKESYNSRSARVGVTRPVFGKNYVTIDNVRDGVGDLLALMNTEEDE